MSDEREIGVAFMRCVCGRVLRGTPSPGALETTCSPCRCGPQPTDPFRDYHPDETTCDACGADLTRPAPGPAEVEALRERLAAAEAERDVAEQRVTWVCFDCGSHGPFRTVKAGNPIEGEDIDCVCQRCQSANTGQPSDMDTEAMLEQVAALTAEAAALREEVAELREKQRIDEEQCDAMTSEAGGLAREVTALREEVARLKMYDRTRDDCISAEQLLAARNEQNDALQSRLAAAVRALDIDAIDVLINGLEKLIADTSDGDAGMDEWELCRELLDCARTMRQMAADALAADADGEG